MDQNADTSELAKLLKSSSLFVCAQCGTETVALGGMCMCSNCESIATDTRSVLKAKDHVLLDALEKLNASIESNDYASAISVYDSLVAERKSPFLMYAQALLYMKYSNHEIGQIGYENPGFMEGNAVHRQNASKFASLSKKLLTKSIHTSKKEIEGGAASPSLSYNLFLSQIKLGMMRAASATVNDISKLGNSYVYNYALMVFKARREHYDQMIKLAENLANADSFSLNAFYYIGLGFFKKGKYKQAKSILSSIEGLMKSGNLEALMFEIDAQLAT